MTEGPNTPPGEDPKREYAGERDMDHFWDVAQLKREPARQWWYIPLILVLILVSIPWFGAAHTRVDGEYGSVSIQYGPVNWEAVHLGLPVWIWIPLVCTLGLSILTSVAILRFWRDDDSEPD